MFDFIFKRNKISDYRLFDDYFAHYEIKKLQIGSGKKNIIDGWLNTDIVCKSKKVGYLDAGRKFPFEDNTFRYVFSEHIFEHLDFKQAVNMLTECYRVLEPGGILRISTPNFDFLLQLYQNPGLPVHKEYINWATKKYLKDIAKYHRKNEPSPVYVINNFFKDWGHQIIHNLDSISTMLTDAGFTQITPCKVNDSADPELKYLEMHGSTIPQEFNELETMVVEAKKGN
jgi:predicted SAM-dependent methyltransferase